MKTGQRGRGRRALAILQLLLELALVIFFVSYAALNWSEIDSVLGRLSLSGLVASVLAYSTAHLFAVAASTSLLGALGHARPYGMLMGIHLRRLPAKYLPGGIWYTVGRGTDLARDGVPVRQVTELMVLEQILSIWWSGLFGFVLAAIAFEGDVRTGALVATGVWLLMPVLGIAWLLRTATGGRLVGALLVPRVWLSYVMGWSCLALAFTLYLTDAGVALESPLQVSASYLVSWMVGAIAFFAPQGMGVFELVMGKAISGSAPVTADLLWLIGAYRILVLCADLVAWGTGTTHRLLRR